MAEAATVVVGVVLKKLADVLINKSQELKDVHGQIEQMQKELRLIQALLRDADSKRNRNELVTEWLNQIREIANTIATVIDIFRVKIGENRPESSNWFKKMTTAVKRNYKTYKHGLRKELEDITGELNRILQRGIQLGIQDKLGDVDEVDDPEPSDNVDDPEVVGLEDDQGKIIEQLLDDSISRRTVLSIVGTGGLGKTTLAQKVYKSAESERQFHCRAWLSISQKYNLNDIWREIFYSIESQRKKQKPPVTDRDLLMMLKSSLRCKRYLIILDDVWDINLWEQLKIALPDLGNASRVIITTRSIDVAKAADCNTKPYELRYLSDTEGLALLFKTAFQQHVQPENYPHLLKVAKKLTKKCGGLPLALVVLGGILTRRDRTYSAWCKVEETMDWSNEDGEKCMKIIARSYEDLPDHLKSCFLYFASFPEDYKIFGSHVTRMWIVEEFIPKDGGGTIEDRAEKCLEELVQSMHDILRDLAISKAKEENFCTIFYKAEDDVNQLAARMPHRAALQFCTLTKNGVYSINTRSLLCFGFGKYSSDDCGFSKLNYSSFRLLRVLTLESVDMTTFTREQWPKGLIHLRYLGLRDCYIPKEIFTKLSFDNLETIDLKGSSVHNDEEEIDWYDIVIPTLRHVYGCRFYLPLRWNQHTNLQTIKYVAIEEELVGELGCCINLRTLVIEFHNATGLEFWETLKGVLRMTQQLVHLHIITHGWIAFSGTTDLPCHEKIQKLYLQGWWPEDICVPSVEIFPTNLTKLILKWSALLKDPMPILERLQSLRILYLLEKSYLGTEMVCSNGGFPNLEILKLSFLYNLHYWDIKEGAMPTLTHLQIEHCDELHTLPELQKVPTLQELSVRNPSCELRKSMQAKDDLYKIKQIPSVLIERGWWQAEDYKKECKQRTKKNASRGLTQSSVHVPSLFRDEQLDFESSSLIVSALFQFVVGGLFCFLYLSW